MGGDLWSRFKEVAERRKEEEAIVVWENWKKGERKTITYGQLQKWAERIGQALLKANLKKGERVTLLAETNILWAQVALGLAYTGSLIVPLDPLLSERELGYIFKEVQPEIALTDSELIEKIESYEGVIGKIVALGVSGRYFTLDNFLYSQKKSIKPPHIQSDDPLIVCYTSGTSGFAKGAVLTHKGFLEITSPGGIERLDLTPKEVIMVVGPFHHVMGFFALVTTLILGAKIVYTRDFKNILLIAGKEKVTVLLGPPKLFRVMFNSIEQGVRSKGKVARLMWELYPKKIGRELKKRYSLENFRFFVGGSAKTDPRVIDGFRRMGFGFAEGYGMSENCSLSHVSLPFGTKAGSVGPLIRGMEEMIVRVESQEERLLPVLDKEGNFQRVKPGEFGEVCLRGPNIMKEYLERPDLTEQAIDKNGWFHTGDYGKIDKDGWLWLEGRIDEMMITSEGKNISKVEIETVLQRSPLVEEVVVDLDENGRVRAWIYPVWEEVCGHELRKEEVREYIEANTREIIEILWEDLQQRQRKALAPFKRVAKSGLQIVAQPFEKTSTQKIKRQKVGKKNCPS